MNEPYITDNDIVQYHQIGIKLGRMQCRNFAKVKLLDINKPLYAFCSFNISARLVNMSNVLNWVIFGIVSKQHNVIVYLVKEIGNGPMNFVLHR